jgi:hypothetical protein
LNFFIFIDNIFHFLHKAIMRSSPLILFLIINVNACIPIANGLEDKDEPVRRESPTNYASIQDTGLSTPIQESKEAIIQASEASALKSTYESMEQTGFESAEDWQKGSIKAASTMSFSPLSPEDIAAKVEAEINGEVYIDPEPISKEQVILEQTRLTKEFTDQIDKDLPSLSDVQLVNLRIKLTVALAVLETQSRHNDEFEGINPELIELFRKTNLSLRELAIEEMHKRGLLE